MKTTTRSNINATVAAIILTTALAVTATAQTQIACGPGVTPVCFKGALQGQDVDSGFTGATVQVATTGTGIGTLLGQFSFTQQETVNLAALTATGSAHWIAANGDSIDTAIVGSAEPTDTPGTIRITEIHTITGGTGRFAGAQGSFTVERLASGVTFLTAGSFHGSITAPSAAH